MPGDGVSLPTTLAQLGNVAKVQARAASPPQPTTPFAERAEQRGELSARRVQETKEDQAQRRLDADQHGLDKRQRRRQRRQGRADGPDEGLKAFANLLSDLFNTFRSKINLGLIGITRFGDLLPRFQPRSG